MSPEDRVLSLCCRQAFDAAHAQELQWITHQQRVCWTTVCHAAVRHGIAPLVYANLVGSQGHGTTAPAHVLETLKKSYVHNVVRKRVTGTLLARVLTMCADRTVDVLLVNSAALSVSVYRKPWYVVSERVDLLLRPQGEHAGQGALGDVTRELDALNQGVSAFRERFEYGTPKLGYEAVGAPVQMDPARIWAHARRASFRTLDVWVPRAEDMLLFAAINCRAAGYFHLGRLCDLAEIIARSPHLDWEEIAVNVRAYSHGALLYNVLLIASEVLRCDVPAHFLHDLAESRVRTALTPLVLRRLVRSVPLADLAALTKRPWLRRLASWPVARWSRIVFDAAQPRRSAA